MINEADLFFKTMPSGQDVFIVRNQDYSLSDVRIVTNLLNDFYFANRSMRFEYYGKKSEGHAIGVYCEWIIRLNIGGFEMICGKCDGWIINTHNWDDDQMCDCEEIEWWRGNGENA